MPCRLRLVRSELDKVPLRSLKNRNYDLTCLKDLVLIFLVIDLFHFCICYIYVQVVWYLNFMLCYFQSEFTDICIYIC